MPASLTVMWEIIEEIEQAGERCRLDAAKFNNLVPSIIQGAEDFESLMFQLFANEGSRLMAILKQPAKEAIDTLDYVHEKIVPRIEAIQRQALIHPVDLNMITIRGAIRSAEGLQAKAMAHLTEQMRGLVDRPVKGDLTLNRITTTVNFIHITKGLVVGTMILPDLSKPLISAASHFKVKYHDMKPKAAPGPQQITQHFSGDNNMGNKYAVNTTGANVGAIAVGDNAHAQGTVNVGAPATQEEHRARISEAQQALLRDQDDLDQLHPGLYEALGQFLRMAREIQVEQKSMAELQAKMKSTLDDMWAQQEAKGLRPQVLPKTLEVAKVILSNPHMMEVVKNLLKD